MVDSTVAEDAFINSMIGEGTRLSGDLDLSGLLRIDGDFRGTIRTRGKVLIGRTGRANCTIYAGTVVLGGVVRGNIFASERIVILSTGMMIGNVNTPRLIVEEGVILNGTCTVEGQPSSAGVRREPALQRERAATRAPAPSAGVAAATSGPSSARPVAAAPQRP
jgi:cytoskeletal protein CcmA (bactofilin family)